MLRPLAVPGRGLHPAAVFSEPAQMPALRIAQVQMQATARELDLHHMPCRQFQRQRLGWLLQLALHAAQGGSSVPCRHLAGLRTGLRQRRRCAETENASHGQQMGGRLQEMERKAHRRANRQSQNMSNENHYCIYSQETAACAPYARPMPLMRVSRALCRGMMRAIHAEECFASAGMSGHRIRSIFRTGPAVTGQKCAAPAPTQ